jgi:hypothetical protein
MKTQITHVSIHQTSKVFALLYFCFSLLAVPIGIVMIAGGPQGLGMGVFLIFTPVIYGVMGYLGSAVFGLLYNFLAARVGGIEFERIDQPGTA